VTAEHKLLKAPTEYSLAGK